MWIAHDEIKRASTFNIPARGIARPNQRIVEPKKPAVPGKFDVDTTIEFPKHASTSESRPSIDYDILDISSDNDNQPRLRAARKRTIAQESRKEGDGHPDGAQTHQAQIETQR